MPRTAAARRFNAQFLRYMRERRGLTQQELGNLVGVSQFAVNLWENGHTPTPSRRNLRKLSEVFFGNDDVEIWFRASVLPGESSTEDGYNYLPHRWLAANHSSFELFWVPVDRSEFRLIADLVRSHYGRTPKDISMAVHVEASRAYAISNLEADKPDMFLKVLKDHRTPDQLHRLLVIHDLISNSLIFQEKFAACLRPSSPSRQVPSETRWIRVSDGRQAIAFPFVDGAKDGRVTHFQGSSDEELIDVGRKLASVNKILNQNELPSMQASDFLRERTQRLSNDVIESIESINHSALIDRRSYILNAESELIRKTHDQIKGILVMSPDAYPMTLHDFHPHNVFVLEDECVLIVDFEGARKDWPEEGTVLFSLHRFCREYVRYFFLKNQQQDEVALATEAANAFLKGYKEKRDLKVTSTAILWAKAINFAKLMDNLAYGNTYNRQRVADASGRTEEQHYREVIKFVSYLREFEIFEKALGSLV